MELSSTTSTMRWLALEPQLDGLLGHRHRTSTYPPQDRSG